MATKAVKEIARKITITTIAGKASAWFTKVMEAKGDSVKLCRLYGSATGFTLGATEFGEFCKFRGTFRGVNLMTGESQDSPQIILPDHLAEMLKSAIEAAQGGAVSFAFEISAVFDVTVATKYRFIAESNLPAVKNDPLALLEAAMADAGFALPAPADANQPQLPGTDDDADEAPAQVQTEPPPRVAKRK